MLQFLWRQWTSKPCMTRSSLIHVPVGWGGWGGVITFMFLCTHRHSNLIIFLAVQQTQALLFHDQLPVGWGGVGWSNNVHVPGHSNFIIFLVVQLTQALLIHDQIPVRWGGVGRGNNVHVPVHTQAQQPHHLSCCPADTGTALS